MSLSEVLLIILNLLLSIGRCLHSTLIIKCLGVILLLSPFKGTILLFIHVPGQIFLVSDL